MNIVHKVHILYQSFMAGQRSRNLEKAQGTVEFIVIVTIVVAVVAGTAWTVFDEIRQFLEALATEIN